MTNSIESKRLENIGYEIWLQETLNACSNAHSQIKKLFGYYASPERKKRIKQVLEFQSGIEKYVN